MSPEERLNRLERVMKMMIRSGRRTRGNFGFRINALIDAQISGEHEFNERFAKLSVAQDRTDEQIKELVAAQKLTERKLAASHAELERQLAASHTELAASQKELAASQQHTDDKLRTLIEIIGYDRNDTNN